MCDEEIPVNFLGQELWYSILCLGAGVTGFNFWAEKCLVSGSPMVSKEALGSCPPLDTSSNSWWWESFIPVQLLGAPHHCKLGSAICANPWPWCLSHPFWGLESTFRSSESCGVTGKRQSTSQRSPGLSCQNADSSPLTRILSNVGPDGDYILSSILGLQDCGVTQGRIHCFVVFAC